MPSGDDTDHARPTVTIRPPPVVTTPANGQAQGKSKPSSAQVLKERKMINAGQPIPGAQIKPEDKPDTPEYKKKHAMIKGPILELARDKETAYGMDECTFTGLKDIFLALLESKARIGILSPQRFLEIFKRDNELFRNSMHQDAHEFYGIVLNDVIANVEHNAKRFQQNQGPNGNGLIESMQNAIGEVTPGNPAGYKSPGTGWVHDIFEGLLTSQTRCLTCETTSHRDETFLDLSIDLEEHSSVTSCLRKFSAEEMLCERNKFHCDHCGGLQEAEKRMKVKRLPKVLTLHLKRFKYTEDYSRLQKLFHRVVYPYYLRMFNTTDEAEDPDRMYELYAVVVHIGGNAYHGHYVSIIKTKERGWLLFDDEMVEPVDKHFVRNFFGDKPGTAAAYVLFYRETTFEKVREEQEAEGMEEVMLATQAANLAQEDGAKVETAPLKRQTTQPAVPVPPVPENEPMPKLAHAKTAPDLGIPLPPQPVNGTTSSFTTTVIDETPELSRTESVKPATKEDRKREKEERKAAEKAEKAALKQAQKDRDREAKEEDKQRKEAAIRSLQQRRAEQEEYQKVLDDSRRTAALEQKTRQKDGEPKDGTETNMAQRSKSLSRKSFGFFNKDKTSENGTNGEAAEPKEKDNIMGRLSMNLRGKKSQMLQQS